MKKNTRKIFVFLLFAFLCIIFSCKSINKETYHNSKNNELNLVFLGDIMAHTANFRTKDYNVIWDGIREITSSSDFTFANIESPVSNDIPFMNYPNFNMQYSYPQAAIDAGVNVMTVANNHTNDHFETGIKSTYEWTKAISKKYENTQRPIYFSGLKEDVSSIKNASQSPCSFSMIEKNGIKILFFGITQILNTPSCNQMINFFPGTENGKKSLLDMIKKLRIENPCDFFILALHSDEPEYVLEVKPSQKKFYFDLLDAGVDILWANHPHTPKPMQWILDENSDKITKAIFYANGNTISAQRYSPNFQNPQAMREYTGDGLCIQVKIQKTKNSSYIKSYKINLITNILDKDKNIVIKKLDQDLLHELEKNQEFQLKDYLEKRQELLLKLIQN